MEKDGREERESYAHSLTYFSSGQERPRDLLCETNSAKAWNVGMFMGREESNGDGGPCCDDEVKRRTRHPVEESSMQGIMKVALLIVLPLEMELS